MNMNEDIQCKNEDVCSLCRLGWNENLLGSIPRSSHTKDSKMVLDASLLNTQQYKVRIKGKVEQSRERSSTLPYTSV